MDRDLWPAIPRRETARFVPDWFAALCEVRQCRRRQAVDGEVVGQAQRVELAHCVRKQVDADAERLDALDALEDAHRQTGTMQAERRGETSDPTARDHDIVHASAHE